MKPYCTLFSFALLLGLCMLFTACKKNEEPPAPNPKVELVSTLSGIGEKPNAVSTTAAKGNFAAVVDTITRVLSYTVTYSGLTPTMGHLHRITPKATDGLGPVEIPFTSLTSPITGTTTLATAGRVDSLLRGYYYANLHTTAYPAGEIRGNIRVKGNVGLTAMLTGAAEKPTPNASAATGEFTAVLSPDSRMLAYTVNYSGLTPTMGHLHRITPNATNGVGPVEIPFPSLVVPIVGVVKLESEGRMDSLLNGFYYANLHTTAYPAGEIRGDIKLSHLR